MRSDSPISQTIDLQAYTYALPDERIARFPLAERDQSRLQVYRKGEITHTHFNQLSHFIPEGAMLVFNNTRVIPARLHFQKMSTQGQPGAIIEVLLLEPEKPSRLLSEAMQAQGHCVWHGMIGNQKRWRAGLQLERTLVIDTKTIVLTASLLDSTAGLVEFRWPEAYTFAEILRHCGEMPLPPYLKRKAAQADDEQYQTVYSQKEGAVAAPTAGLHFTEQVLHDLSVRGIETEFITLHVGAGTFQPIKTHDIWQHPMHAEQVVFTRQNIQHLLQKLPQVLAVGTTSLRSLESLYWFGVKVWQNPDEKSFWVEKLLPYQFEAVDLPSVTEALEAIDAWMKRQQLDEIVGETQILIAPGYTFKICKGLITNYHLPGTTLILLVAALIGEDWRRVYEEALTHGYRFLSYGDSSLLIP